MLIFKAGGGPNNWPLWIEFDTSLSCMFQFELVKKWQHRVQNIALWLAGKSRGELQGIAGTV